MFANPDAFSDEAGVFSYFDFTNKVISQIYDIIHEERLPRVTEEMRSGLQLKKGKATGDWFLYHHATVIRIYCFQGFPYVLLACLTPRVFYLEFARQRIAAEELHFGRTHKTSNLKFPFTLGPFTFKSKSCITTVESYMCQFQFLLAYSICNKGLFGTGREQCSVANPKETKDFEALHSEKDMELSILKKKLKMGDTKLVLHFSNTLNDSV